MSLIWKSDRQRSSQDRTVKKPRLIKSSQDINFLREEEPHRLHCCCFRCFTAAIAATTASAITTVTIKMTEYWFADSDFAISASHKQ